MIDCKTFGRHKQISEIITNYLLIKHNLNKN